MKKRIMMILTIAFMTIFFASFSEAKEYVVVKGDCLSKIASKHAVKLQHVLDVNKKIQNKNLIFPGQKIIIPEKVSKKVIVRDRMNWTNPGANPFTADRDIARAINMFSVPADVKSKWIEAVQNEEPIGYGIKKGDVFQEMIFGNYIISKNVHAAWDDASHFEPADMYSVDGEDGKVYVLYRPEICDNWAWTIGEKVEEIIPKEAEAPIVEQKIPTEAKVEDKKELLVVASATMAETDVKKTSSEELCSTCQFKPDHDTYIFGGRYWGIQGDGAMTYYGIDSSLFVTECLLGNGKLKVGPSILLTGWDGFIGSGYDRSDYTGSKFLYGAAAMYETDSSRTRLEYRFGEKAGDITANDGQYRAHETANLHQIDIDHEWWNGRTWFGFYKVGVTAIIAEGEQKTATWNGSPITDTPVGQGEITARVRTHVYTNEWITTFAEAAVGYRGFDHAKTGEIYVGVKHPSGLEIGGAYQIIEGASNDLVAIKAAIDINDLITYVIKNIPSSETEGGK